MSDHFDGKKFFNPGHGPMKGLSAFFKWRLTHVRTRWPENIENTATPAVATHVEDGRAVVTFVNHASFLVQLAGLNLITDPHYSERASPFSFMGPKRVRQPGLPFEAIPKLGVVLVSHNHYDHLDLETLKRLDQAHSPLFLVAMGDAAWLRRAGLKRVEELDWWQSHSVGAYTITYVPAMHWSARSPFDRNHSLWGGFVIKGNGVNVFFAGDTGYGPHFKKICEHLGAPDVALLPIGAYEPRWFMKQHHMNPADAVEAHVDLKAKKSLGMHFGTFHLTDEAIDDPPRHLADALAERKLPANEFIAPQVGETLHFP